MKWVAAECRRIGWTTVWSWRGWTAAWATERSLRQWSIANLVSASLALALPLTIGERALILALGILVLAAELFNTAIEEVVDFMIREQHPSAAKAKDCGSAGVALAALAAGVAWVIVMWGHYGP